MPSSSARASPCLLTLWITLAPVHGRAQVYELVPEPPESKSKSESESESESAPAQPPIAYRFRPRRPPIVLSMGYIGSIVGGANPATGHGVEVSSVFYLPDREEARFGIGPVLQVQNYSSPSHGRVGAGLELASLLGGLELLYAYRHGVHGHATTHGLTLGPYLSLLGILHVAGRFTFALSPTGSPTSYGNEYGLTLGAKLPLILSGDLWGTSRGPERVPPQR